MSIRKAQRGRGSLVIDFQGPFELATRLIREGGIPFVTVDLWPDVSIFITSEVEADSLIAVMQQAKALLPKAKAGVA